MSSSPNLDITLLSGSQSNKYVTVNTAINALDGALCALAPEVMPSDADFTIPTTDALGNMAFKVTSGVTLTATRNVIVPTNKKPYIVSNATTGGQAIVVKTSAGTGITLVNGGGYTWLYCDGTNVVAIAAAGGIALEVNGTPNGSQSLLNLKAGTNVTITDDMAGGITIATTNGVATGGQATKTTGYTAASGDTATLITLNSASALTLTLPASIPGATWCVFLKNIGTGVVTVARNGFDIDGQAANATLTQGDAIGIFTDNSNWFTQGQRITSLWVFAPGVGANSQVYLYIGVDRPCIFPASAPNSFAVASVAATGSTTFTLSKNGSAFATIVFSASGTTGAWTQASDATFAAGDILSITGPATADVTLANLGISLQGYRF